MNNTTILHLSSGLILSILLAAAVTLSTSDPAPPSLPSLIEPGEIPVETTPQKPPAPAVSATKEHPLPGPTASHPPMPLSPANDLPTTRQEHAPSVATPSPAPARTPATRLAPLQSLRKQTFTAETAIAADGKPSVIIRRAGPSEPVASGEAPVEPGSLVMELSSGVRLPLAIVAPEPPAPLDTGTAESSGNPAIMNSLVQQFVAEMEETADIATFLDPAEIARRFARSRQTVDERYRMLYGDAAWNAAGLQAARDAMQP